MLLKKIAVAFTMPQLQKQAEQLANKLQLPLVAITDTQYDFLLVYTEKHLEICPFNQPTLGTIYIDFLTGKLGFRRSHTFIKNELLAKAIGVKGNQQLNVLDTTAGLGRDSFILACLGCNVIMLERSPIIAVLLEDGLTRLLATEKLNLSLIQTNAIEYLKQLDEKNYPEVIYLDPMYPHRTKSALVKKEMRVIRELVGDDEDAEQLVLLAIKRAKKRVVVKRPRLAPALSEQKPDIIYTGKQHRFDVYLV